MASGCQTHGKPPRWKSRVSEAALGQEEERVGIGSRSRLSKLAAPRGFPCGEFAAGCRERRPSVFRSCRGVTGMGTFWREKRRDRGDRWGCGLAPVGSSFCLQGSECLGILDKKRDSHSFPRGAKGGPSTSASVSKALSGERR